MGDADAVLREEAERRGAFAAPVRLDVVGTRCRPVLVLVDEVEDVAFESVRRAG